VALVDDEIAAIDQKIKVLELEVACGTRPTSLARLTLEIDGMRQEAEAEGSGPVDATFNAIRKLVPHEAILALFQIHAVTEGTDGQAEVTVRLEENDKTVVGNAAETDTILGAARAYTTALNKLLTKRERTAPTVMSA
jgi:2-isopropylmalate synthase